MENVKENKEGEKVTIYYVRYEVPGKKKMRKSTWRMTPEDAAKHFAGVKYKIEEFDSYTFTRGNLGAQGNFTDNWPADIKQDS